MRDYTHTHTHTATVIKLTFLKESEKDARTLIFLVSYLATNSLLAKPRCSGIAKGGAS